MGHRRCFPALAALVWLLSPPIRASEPRAPHPPVPSESPRTERALEDGVQVTRTYDEKKPSILRRVEAGGEIHTFTYDEAYSLVLTKTVEISGTILTLTNGSGSVAASGLPNIAIKADDAGRVREIALATGTVATFLFDRDGRNVEITLRGGLRLLVETIGASLRQTLHAPQGNILWTSVFEREPRRGFVARFNLDMLAPSLGLTRDWGRGRSLRLSRTGQSEAVVGETGETLIRILGGVASGKALVDLVTTVDGKPLGYRVTLSGMGGGIPGFPWRVLVTPDQGISLDSPTGPSGSVISLWSRGGDAGFRLDRQPAGEPERRKAPDVDSCFSSVCTTSGSIATCEWEPYWCDDGRSWGRAQEAADTR